MGDFTKEDWRAGYCEDERPGGCFPLVLAVVLAMVVAIMAAEAGRMM